MQDWDFATERKEGNGVADLIFRNTPYGDIIVYDSWPAWQRNTWLALLGVPQAPAWAPTYDGPFTVRAENGVTALLNPFGFASAETATEIMKRFGAERIVSLPYEGGLGPFTSTGMVRWAVWSDGLAIKAGLLASHFTRNPEDLYPNVAQQACLHDIADSRRSGQRLPTA